MSCVGLKGIWNCFMADHPTETSNVVARVSFNRTIWAPYMYFPCTEHQWCIKLMPQTTMVHPYHPPTSCASQWHPVELASIRDYTQELQSVLEYICRLSVDHHVYTNQTNPSAIFHFLGMTFHVLAHICTCSMGEIKRKRQKFRIWKSLDVIH